MKIHIFFCAYSLIGEKMKRKLLILSFFLIFIVVFLILFEINQKVKPKLEQYSEYELKKFNSLIINQTIIKEINDTVSLGDLFSIPKSEENSIHTIDFNPIAVNRLLSIITNSIQTDFQKIEQGQFEELSIKDTILSSYHKDLLKRGIVFTIPSGMVFDNFLFSNLGPKIPVRFSLTGDIISNIQTKVTNYGINNALIEVFANVTISERMILPFFSKNIQTTVSVPIIMKLIEGSVPNYYFSGIDKNSNIFSLPIQ